MALIEAISTLRVHAATPVTNLEFTSIPATYNHLQLACNMKGDNTADALSVGLQVGNSSIDTGSNYSWGYMTGQSGTSEIGGVTAPSTSIRNYDFMYGSGAELYEYFGYMTIFIADYADTNKNTSMQVIGGGIGSADSKIQLQANTWDSTAAVTNIKVFAWTNNFVHGTEMTLYGIKDS